MSRTTRLFDLLQLLRRYRYPVSGVVLAAELGISLRSLYRDIKSLQAQGAEIEGEAGIGYVLRPGFILPPLMFLEEEIEALVLGTRWVANRADSQLKTAAHNALAKIAAVLPPDLKHQLEISSLLIGPGQLVPSDDETLATLRLAIRQERKLEILYKDGKEEQSARIICPLGIGFFDRVRIVIAWCDLRKDFRHFRTDRIISAKILDSRYAKSRQTLLDEWHQTFNIPKQ
jgi:predicted DNA-binding transcriptional regulator YafY